jgi:hypothetical protein
LIQYLEENPASAVNAVDGFLRCVKLDINSMSILTLLIRTINSIDSFDYNAEVSITIAEERVVRSITTIKVSFGLHGLKKHDANTDPGFSPFIGGYQTRDKSWILRNCRYRS